MAKVLEISGTIHVKKRLIHTVFFFLKLEIALVTSFTTDPMSSLVVNVFYLGILLKKIIKTVSFYSIKTLSNGLKFRIKLTNQSKIRQFPGRSTSSSS